MNCDKCGLEVERKEDATWLDCFRTGQQAAAIFLSSARHIRCSSSRAQYITAPEFGEPVVDERPSYDKRLRGPDEVKGLEESMTNAWNKLQQQEEV